MPPGTWRRVTLVLLTVTLVGCVFRPADKAVTTVPLATKVAVEPKTPPVGLNVGNTAPDFELQDLQGDTIRLSDLRGKTVMINFWAVWCGYCRTELPAMQAAYETYRDKGFVILAIDVQEDVRTVSPFVKKLGLTFPVPLDQDGQVTLSYRIRGLPTSYFVDQNGVIQGIQVGPVDKEWIRQQLSQAGVE